MSGPTDLPARLDALVETAYAAVYQPSRWQQVLVDYAEAMDAEAGGLHAPPADGVKRGAIFFSHNMDPTPILDKVHLYGRMAPYADRAIAMGIVPGVILSHEVIPQEEMRATDYYREFMRPMRIEHGMQSLFRVSRQNSRGPISLNVGRSERRAPFGDTQRRAAQAAFPHLRRAITLAVDVAPSAMLDAAVGEALDGFATPCFLLGAGSRLIFANAAARRLLEAGNFVGSREQHLFASDRRIDATLANALARACDPGAEWFRRAPSEVALTGRDGGRAIVVVAPLGSDNPFLNVGPIRAAAYLLEDSPETATRGEIARMAQLYALTPAEAEVTAALVAGGSAAEIAARRGVSAHTVKTQMKVIFEKTQSSRQVDLVRLYKLFAVRPASGR